MSKKLRKIKIIKKPVVSKKGFELKLNQLAFAVERINQTIDRIHQLLEANRLGIVTVNRMMTKSEWPIVLNKTHQFLFGLVLFLKSKYPNILDEIHQHMINLTYEQIDENKIESEISEEIQKLELDRDELERFLGDLNTKFSYTEEDFREFFRVAAGLISNDETEEREITDGELVDEEGTIEEAAKEFDEFIKTVNEGKTTYDEEFIEKLGVDIEDNRHRDIDKG
jgi:hypothetical protein